MSFTGYLSRLRNDHRAIFINAVLLIVLTVLMIIMMMFDHRELGGYSVWMKPVKFSSSIAIFLITLPYYVTALNITERRKHRIQKAILWFIMLEFLLIFVQAARGVKSHFNNDTFLDARIYNLMGVLIMLVTFWMAYVLILYIRPSTRPSMSKPELYAHQVAIALFLFGCAIGGRMVGNFSHDVGAAVQSSHMPITGWNLYSGDLRISHFFAVHSLQIIPIAAALLSNRTVLITSIMMVIITLFFFFNAMAGHGLLS